VTVLGEIPQRQAALEELSRVLRPGGRLVIGEFADRHHVTLPTLIRMANAVGLSFERRTGMPFAYYARLAPQA
jgi:ubiquinone/menaquinone biosynthesis C-methylase UbiE